MGLVLMAEKKQKPEKSDAVATKIDSDKYYAGIGTQPSTFLEFKTELDAQTFLLAKRLATDWSVGARIGLDVGAPLTWLNRESLAGAASEMVLAKLNDTRVLETVGTVLSDKVKQLEKSLQACPQANKKIRGTMEKYLKDVKNIGEKVELLLKKNTIDEGRLKEVMLGIVELNKIDKTAASKIARAAYAERPQLTAYEREFTDSELNAEVKRGYVESFELSNWHTKPLSGAQLEYIQKRGDLAIKGTVYLLNETQTDERNGRYVYQFSLKDEPKVEITIARAKPLPLDFLPKEIDAQYFIQKVMTGAKLVASEGAQEKQTNAARQLQMR